MLVSDIASSVSLRKSLSFTGSSPAASRCELTIIRRYFATVTPGIATGYWKAMKRPMRERSSGSASVISSPLKVIVPSVTSRLGWPMIALASVDLPEPLGPMSAWMVPSSTSRLTPLRISLPSAVTCRLRISSSANSTPRCICVLLRRGDRGGLRCGRGSVLVGELHQLGQRRAGERLGDAALHPGPEKLGGAGLVAVSLVRTGDLSLGVGLKTLHRSDRALERLDHLEHLDLVSGAPEAVAAVGAALALDQPGLAQLGDQVLEVGERKALRFGDRAERHRGAIFLAAQLDHQPHAIFGSGGKEHRL